MTKENRLAAPFLSYSRQDKDIVDQLDALMAARGVTVIRDERDLHYGDSIATFIQTGRRTSKVILVISHTYLTSLSCLREVMAVLEEGDGRDRIRPLILPSADLFSPLGRSRYVQYWDNKYRELEQEVCRIPPEAAVELILDLRRIKQIREQIGTFLHFVSDRYSCTTVTEFVSDFLSGRGGEAAGSGAARLEAVP